MNIPGYQIGEELCTTPFSVVYRGRRAADGQPVIIKVLRQADAPPDELASFKREYETLRSLNLPGVINAISLEVHQHRWVMVLEDFGGESRGQYDVADRFQAEQLPGGPLEHLLDTVSKEMPFDQAVFLLVDEQGAMLTGGLSRGLAPEQTALLGQLEIPLTRQGGAAAEALMREETVLLSSELSSEDNAPLSRLMQAQSILLIPLQGAEGPVGLLAAGSTTSDRPITEKEQGLLQALSRSTAVAIESARQLQAWQRRAHEAETLYHAGTAVSAALQQEQAIKHILEQLALVVPYDSASVQLLRPGYLEIVGGRGWSDPAVVEELRFPVPGDNPNTVVIQECRPVVLTDAPAEYEAFRETTASHIRSWLGVPLVVRGRVTGMLAIDSTERDYFTHEHVALASTFADQVAIAVENSRLFEAERELRARSEALDKAAAALTSTLEYEQVLDRILEQVGQVIACDAVNMMLVEGNQARLVRWRGYTRSEVDELISTVALNLSDATNLQQMIDTQEPMAIPDVTQYPGWIRTASVEWMRSYAGAPIVTHGEVTGFLNVGSATAGFYTQEQAESLRAFADHAAVAIQNARLYAQARQRLAELEALQSTSLELTSSLDLPTVLDSIADSVLALTGASDCLIYLYDEASDTFTFGTAAGSWAQEGHVYAPRRSGLTAMVVQERHPVVINDAADHPLFASAESREWNVQAAAGFPLQRAGRVLGVLDIVFVEPHTFQEEELRVLGLLSDQATIAIENARLFEAERAKLEELRVLHAVATAGAEATQEDLLIERVTTIIGETLYPADVFGAMLLDEAAGVLHLHPSYQVAKAKEHLWRAALATLVSEDGKGIVIPLGQGITGTVAATGRPWRIGDVTQVPEYIDGGVGTLSELCVPLKVGGRVIGVINAESVQQDAFSEADERLLTTVAGQLATAIEKLRLYQAAQREIAERVRAEDELRKHRDHLEELVQERTAALTQSNAQLQQEILERVQAQAERERLLAAERAQARRQAALLRLSAELAATLDEPEVCSRVVHSLQATLGYDVLGLFLVDEATGDRVLKAVIGFESAPDRIPAGQGLSERALLDGNLHYTPDVTQDPRYVFGEGGSEVDVPIRIGEEVLGVLIAENQAVHAFNEDDFEVLTAAAQQAGLAIEKARLLAAERQRADELDALRTTMADITAELELSALLEAVVERAAGLLDATGGELGLYEQAEQEIRIVVSRGLGKDYVGTRHGLGEGAMGRVMETGEPLIIEDYHAWDGRAPDYDEMPVHAVLAAPLEVGGRLLGIITVATTNPDRKFDPADLHLLHLFAQQAAIALENARLFDQAQREIAERIQAEARLREHQEHLEELVQERTSKLRESEERYRSLFDGVPVGLYRTTPAGKILDANLAFVQMAGHPGREHLLATNASSLYADPEARAEWGELMEKEGIVRDFESRLRRYDGTVIWTSDAARAVRDESGRVLYYEGSFEDITERKRSAEELRKYREQLEELVEARTAELRASEERYRTLFDGVPVGLYRSTPAGRMLDANPAFAQIVGFASREELMAVDDTARFYVDPEEQVRWRALMDRDGVVRDFETQFYTADGTVRWGSETARAVRDEGGQVLYYEGSIEDITERKQFEQEIRRQKEYFEALFVNSPVAVLTADMDIRVVSWNPAAERLFGYSKEEAMGTEVDDLVANNPALREEAEDFSRQTFARGRFQATARRTRKDGSLVDVEILAVPVIVTGEQIGFIAVYYDITELLEARRAAETASQAKSAFLANMSHELRTPLNAILGFTQLMDGDANLTGEQQENLGIINRSGEHLLALINDVLEMSKIEAGRVALQETRFDLHRMLGGLEEMFALRAARKGLSLSLERAMDVPQHVRADESKLRQVLVNLLGNAIKFTAEGRVTLRVSRALPDRLHFEVQDSGPGMTAGELAVAFDPFVQAASGQQSQEGTGLGLSISRRYVHLLGGELTAVSEPGHGCLFQFDVKIEPVKEADVEALRPSRRVLGLEPDQPAYRLLVVEDKETNRRLLVKLLEPLGFEVREAVNGQEAVEMCESWEPHLIWMDMRMPVMDGHEATRRIKATPKGQATVIIALTATVFEEDRERVLLEGCHDFVRKPFRKDEIYHMLEKHLGVRFLYGEAEEEASEAAAPVTDVLTPAALAALPAGWVADLQQATLRADLDRILALVGEIRGHSPVVAEALENLAHNFEYQQIASWAAQAGDSQES